MADLCSLRPRGKRFTLREQEFHNEPGREKIDGMGGYPDCSRNRGTLRRRAIAGFSHSRRCAGLAQHQTDTAPWAELTAGVRIEKMAAIMIVPIAFRASLGVREWR
jgi:hypothetical protein